MMYWLYFKIFNLCTASNNYRDSQNLYIFDISELKYSSKSIHEFSFMVDNINVRDKRLIRLFLIFYPLMDKFCLFL